MYSQKNSIEDVVLTQKEYLDLQNRIHDLERANTVLNEDLYAQDESIEYLENTIDDLNNYIDKLEDIVCVDDILIPVYEEMIDYLENQYWNLYYSTVSVAY